MISAKANEVSFTDLILEGAAERSEFSRGVYAQGLSDFYCTKRRLYGKSVIVTM